MGIDETKKLKVSAAAADVKALCGLMVYGNKTINDIKSLGGETILVPICKSGSVKAFKFISSLMKKSEMIQSCYKSMTWIIRNGRVNLLEHILAIPEIRKKSKDKSFIKNVINDSFVWNGSPQIIDMWMDKLNISNDEVIEVVSKSDFSILRQMIQWNDLRMLKKLKSIFGEERFAQAVIKGGILKRTIKRSKSSLLLYILSLPAVKELLNPKSESAETKNIICRLFYSLFEEYKSEEIIRFISYEYDGNYTVMTRMMKSSTLDKMKRLQTILKEELFIDAVLTSHYKCMNALEWSLRNKTNESHYAYFLSFTKIKQFYNKTDGNDKQSKAIYRMLYYLFAECTNDDIVGDILGLIKFKKIITQKFTDWQYPQLQQSEKKEEAKEEDDDEKSE